MSPRPATGSFATGSLAFTGFLAMMAQVWLGIATGSPTSTRAAVLFVGVAAAVWALVGRADRAGSLETLLVTLAGVGAFWIGALEFVLRYTFPMARGFLVLLTLVALHATLLYLTLRSTRTDRSSGRVAQGLLAALTVGLATLTLLETTTRAISPVRSYELVPDDPACGLCLLRVPDGRLVGVPGCTGRYVHRDFPGLRVELNELGLRDGLDEVTPPPPGTPSIVVLGDSFAFGMGVELDETFQQVVQSHFETSTRDVRVYGAAIPGSGPGHQHLMLRSLADRLQPDVVVLALFEGNDMQDQQAALARRREPGPVQRAGPMSPWSYLASTTRWPFWRTGSSLLQLRRVDGRPTLVLQQAMLETPPASIDPLRQAVLDEVAAIDATVRELGAELVVLLIPGRVQTDPESFETFTARHPRERFSRTNFHDGLADAIEALGVEVVDTLPRFEAEARAGRAAYHPEGHWNAHGHALAAELLIEALGPRLALERPGEKSGQPDSSGREAPEPSAG